MSIGDPPRPVESVFNREVEFLTIKQPMERSEFKVTFWISLS